MRKFFLLIAMVLLCCSCGSDDSSASSTASSKEFSNTWTPQYDKIVGYWNMSTSFFGDGSSFPANIGDSGVVKNPNNIGMYSVSGPVSFALHFDGVDDRIRIPYRNNYNLNLFSVSLWIQIPAPSIAMSAITSRDAPITKGYALYVNASGQPEIRIGRGSLNSWGVATGTVLLNNTWTHIVFTYDGTNVRLYQDGVLTASLLTAYMPNTTFPLYLGAGGTEGDPKALDFFLGNIDEVAIWSSVLSDSDVQAIYQTQKL